MRLGTKNWSFRALLVDGMDGMGWDWLDTQSAYIGKHSRSFYYDSDYLLLMLIKMGIALRSVFTPT